MRKGLTLSEILIATVIIVLVSIPTIGIFLSSKESLTRTDIRREKRYFLNEILARAQRHSLHTLWTNYGPHFAAQNCGLLRDRLAETSGTPPRLLPRPPGGGGPNTRDPNPMGLTQNFIDDLYYAGYEARMRFEFFPREFVYKGITPTPPFDANVKDVPGPTGMLHMQSGFLQISIKSLKDDEDRADWRVPLMCPAIVGRPGLKLEGCPALDDDVRQAFGPRIADREQQWSNQPSLWANN